MKRYKFIVSYDGTGYHGWQRQNNKLTIAGVLESSFYSIFKKKISIIGASRTDAGVHSLGQTACFDVNLPVKSKQILNAWNNLLPPEILIISLIEADQNFHPQKNVRQKTYYYHFFIKRPIPFFQRFGYFYRYPIDFKKLKQSLKVFIGKKDFRSFCTGADITDTIREIDSIKLKYIKEIDAYRIEFKGKSFLRYMIRRIVGACLETSSRNNLTIEFLNYILNSKNPKHILPNAPSKGLVLYKIQYKKEKK